MSGFIYILSNPSLKNLYKIGFTSRINVSERVKELSGTSLPTPFKIEWFKKDKNARKIETHLHKVFNYCRVNKRREFFQIDLFYLINITERELKRIKEN